MSMQPKPTERPPENTDDEMTQQVLAQPPTIQRFKTLQAVAYFTKDWRTCKTRACRRRQTCTGGPRGTFSRFRVPRCLANS